MPEYFFFEIIFIKFQIRFPQSNILFAISYLGMVGPIDVKQKGNESTTLTRVPLTLTFIFDLEFSRSNCISGMGDPIVMEGKGRESIGCPDLKHNHYVTSKQRILLGTGVT